MRATREKRGGKLEKLYLDETRELAQERAPDLIALDDALKSLAIAFPRESEVVELKFFGGLEAKEIAELFSRLNQNRFARLEFCQDLAPACADELAELTPMALNCRAGASPAFFFRFGNRSGCPTINHGPSTTHSRVVTMGPKCRLLPYLLRRRARESSWIMKQAFRAFKSAVSRLRGWSVLAALLMPDHIHLLVAPTEDRDAKLGNLVGALKRWTREELNASWHWQSGSFDRLLRRDKLAHEKWLYIEQNPVTCRPRYPR